MLGELAPKRLALQRAEGLALVVAPFLAGMARAARPVIWLLSRSTNVRRAAARRRPERRPRADHRGGAARRWSPTHESLGRDERELVDDVFAAGDRQLREVMVPRTEVDFLDAATAGRTRRSRRSPTARTRATR